MQYKLKPLRPRSPKNLAYVKAACQLARELFEADGHKSGWPTVDQFERWQDQQYSAEHGTAPMKEFFALLETRLKK